MNDEVGSTENGISTTWKFLLTAPKGKKIKIQGAREMKQCDFWLLKFKN